VNAAPVFSSNEIQLEMDIANALAGRGIASLRVMLLLLENRRSLLSLGKCRAESD
jgi:hypothetical protein